jgi:YebC/PmpR family DNA-binding regulatory protein
MAGHSKWKQIKRAKGITDQKRGALFTKLAREITIAAKAGGGDPDANFRLRMAIQKAKDGNMPLDNIQRAIAKGTGQGEQQSLVEITYEGYTPGGAAVYVQAFTDNKNRTASEVRHVFTHHGGVLGESGSVAWLFSNMGVLSVAAPKGKADDITLAAIDAGAEDVKGEGESLEVYTAPDKLDAVRKGLEAAGAKITSAELQMVPKTTMTFDRSNAGQALRLLDELEDLDDVQKVFTNADFPEEVLAAAG